LRFGKDFDFSVSSNALVKTVTANFTLSGNSDNGTLVEMFLKNQLIYAKSLRNFKFKVKAAAVLLSGMNDFYEN
jgi:hypothetical protein